MNLGRILANQLNQSVHTSGLLRKQLEMFGLRKVSRPLDQNPLALSYHPKTGQLFDLILAKALRQILRLDCR